MRRKLVVHPLRAISDGLDKVKLCLLRSEAENIHWSFFLHSSALMMSIELEFPIVVVFTCPLACNRVAMMRPPRQGKGNCTYVHRPPPPTQTLEVTSRLAATGSRIHA